MMMLDQQAVLLETIKEQPTMQRNIEVRHVGHLDKIVLGKFCPFP